MKRPVRLLKKISEDIKHIKTENIVNYKQFNIYCQDESRFGLMTLTGRRLTIKGVKPICPYQHKFVNTYLFGAFSPINGKHLILELPHCNSANFQVFMDELAKEDKEEFKIMILDNGAFHKAKSLVIPQNIALIFLPPYSPELNPAEKVWWMLKRKLKLKNFKSLEELQNELTEVILKTCTNIDLKTLTAYSYYENAFKTNFNL